MLDTTLAPGHAPGHSRRAREATRLFERYRRARDENARAELVARFLPLAKSLARRYQGRDDYDDLVQVASFALIKAIDRYDPDRGVAFASYAVPTIVGALKHHFRDLIWSVRVPRELHDRALKIQRVSEQLSAGAGRSPTPADVAEAMECSVELVLEALQIASALRPDRLDGPGDDEEDGCGGATLAGEETGYAVAEASATLAPLLARLTPYERKVLTLRFEHDLTQTEIAARLRVSQMQVSRTLHRTIAHLQDLAAERPMTPV
jgi:RNA polymerase sigma-B factor